MLVLSRKPGEEVIIGDDICVTLLEIRGNQARLDLTAPVGTPIWRKELGQLSTRPNRLNSSSAAASENTCEAGPAEIGR
jgi:carbon storage regulator